MTMRTRIFSVVAALLLVSSAAFAEEPKKAADEKSQDVPTTAAPSNIEIGPVNRVDIGIRGTAFGANSDAARFQRFQDLRDGATIDLFRYYKQSTNWLFDARGDHIGYRDQQLSATFNQYGKVKAIFEYNQVPLYFSDSTRTLYSSTTPGILTIDDAIQSGIQNKTLTLPGAMTTSAGVFDLRSKRYTTNFDLTYSLSKTIDFKVNAKDVHRNGSQPWAGTFGISNAVASEMAVPIDTRTNELTTAAEWSNNRGFARLAYEGSFFRNDISSLTFDNPVRIDSSATGGTALGRMALWPGSNMNTVSATGTVKLPGRSSAMGFVSYADMAQNDPLLPFTVNSAIGAIPLPRNTAEAKARVTAMNYSFTSRPANILWFSARYRQYNFDNRTEEFAASQWVNYDTSLSTNLLENEPAGYTRHTFDGDASVSPWRYVGFRVGYTREQVDRTFRVVDQTKEDTVRTSADLTGLSWITVRGVYEHSERNGAAVNIAELIAIGEQPSLRQFDISDRNRDRFSTLVQVTPVSTFSVNASAAIGREDYPGANFGLRNNNNNIYTFGFDFVPSDTVTFGATYGYEEYKALQASRTANPLPAMTDQYLNDPTQQFNDPRRDWTDDSKDLVHTVNVSADLLKLIPKTEVRLGYDLSRGRTTYVYGITADSVLPAPAQLPAVRNELHRATADVQYSISKHLAVGGVYWFDRYLVDDFALNPTASLALPAANPALMLLGYAYRPYTANTMWGRLTYLW
jgi:MtrB/PioB family decaheme-associated outer membrane protein